MNGYWWREYGTNEMARLSKTGKQERDRRSEEANADIRRWVKQHGSSVSEEHLLGCRSIACGSDSSGYARSKLSTAESKYRRRSEGCGETPGDNTSGGIRSGLEGDRRRRRNRL
jgi:hypothetical protein